MITVLSFISAALGISAAIVTIVNFFSNTRRKHKILIFVFVLLFTSTSVVLLIKYDSDKEQEILSELLRQDANSVASGINIYGWEETGDYIGYMTQITSFYQRHKDRFPTEYESYKKQLDNWIEYLRKEREQGHIIPGYSNDLTVLKGLVTSGDGHLTQLAK